VLDRAWRVTADATTVVRKATLGRIVPLLLGQLHALQFRLPTSNRPQAIGRVYAMSRVEASGSGNLVMGSCMIVGTSCCVLYDSGATHPFVSDACVNRLGLSMCELQCELVVSTATSCLVRTSSLCARCPVEVEGRKYKVNMICLPLQELEVILGMD